MNSKQYKPTDRLEAVCGKRHAAVEQQLAVAGEILNRNKQCLKRLEAAAKTAAFLKELIHKTQQQIRQQAEASARKPENCQHVLGCVGFYVIYFVAALFSFVNSLISYSYFLELNPLFTS